MDVIKTEPDSDEDFLSEERQLIDVKLEDDPVPEPFFMVKTEVYVSCIFYLWFIPIQRPLVVFITAVTPQIYAEINNHFSLVSILPRSEY
jgi:hypothetical protein